MLWLLPIQFLFSLVALPALGEDLGVGGIPAPGEDDAFKILADKIKSLGGGGIPAPDEAPQRSKTETAAQAPESSLGGIAAPTAAAAAAEAPEAPVPKSKVFEFVDWHMNSGTHRHLTEKDLSAFEGHSPEDAAELLAKANFEHGRRLITRSKTCGMAPKKEGSRWLYGEIGYAQKAADVDECCKLCTQDEACYHWEYNYVDNTCNLKGDRGYLEHAAKYHYWISGDVELRKASSKPVPPAKAAPPRGVYPSDIRSDL